VRSRQQYPLTLAGRQRISHVSDQALIRHRHRQDRIVDARHTRCSLDAPHVPLFFKEADAVGQRSRQQMVILQDGADPSAPTGRRCRANRLAIDQQPSRLRGLEKTISSRRSETMSDSRSRWTDNSRQGSA